MDRETKKENKLLSSRKCQYCPYISYADNFKSGVAIHTGHSHKCKVCRQISASGFSKCLCNQLFFHKKV